MTNEDDAEQLQLPGSPGGGRHAGASSGMYDSNLGYMKHPTRPRRPGEAPRQLPKTPTLDWEMEMRLEYGVNHIAGVDEAGRGAWAGPVVAAAVILPHDHDNLQEALKGLRDSKKMTRLQRERLFDLIKEIAVAWSTGEGSSSDIDAHGIVGATKLAMTRAVQALEVKPGALLIDALMLTNELPEHPNQTALYYADSISLSVAAASVIAKVSRDAQMVDYDEQYPGYHFAQHKGYGTRLHRSALNRLGPTDIHRKSYKPVADALARQRNRRLEENTPDN